MEREQDKLDGSGKTILDKDGEPVKEKVEVTINAFKPVSTFDVSQTDGDPIPTIGVAELTQSVDGYKNLFDAIKVLYILSGRASVKKCVSPLISAWSKIQKIWMSS